MFTTFLALKFCCVPPDIAKEIKNKLLTDAEKAVKSLFEQPEDVYVGIGLLGDQSEFRIGDVIWAEGVYSTSNMATLSKAAMDDCSNKIHGLLKDFVRDYVNLKERIDRVEGAVPCQFIAVTISQLGTNISGCAQGVI